MTPTGRALLARSGGCAEDQPALDEPAPRLRDVTATTRRQRDEDGFERWLSRATERADPFMAWLGVLFALLVVFDLAADASSSTHTVLSVLSWSIWALFAADYLARLWLAPNRLRFVRRHWLAALMLLVPTLRLLRFAALLRLGRALPASRVIASSYRVSGTARALLGSRLAYLGGIASITALAVAELAFLFERDSRLLPSFGDWLLWSLSVVIALQGDPVPHSVPGRLAMLGGFVVGLVVVASLAGSLGAFLVERHIGERQDAGPAPNR